MTPSERLAALLAALRTTPTRRTLAAVVRLVNAHPDLREAARTGVWAALGIAERVGNAPETPPEAPDAIETALGSALGSKTPLTDQAALAGYLRNPVPDVAAALVGGVTGTLGLNQPADLLAALVSEVGKELAALGVDPSLAGKLDREYLRQVWTGLRAGVALPEEAGVKLPGLDRLLARTGRDLDRLLARALSEGWDADRLVREWGRVVTARRGEVYTLANTHLQAAARTALVAKVEQAGAELGVEVVYQYLGPRDRVTRPFCRRLLDRKLTLAEIRKLDNGQGLPVLTHGGGYNCRHRWVPVRPGDAG